MKLFLLTPLVFLSIALHSQPSVSQAPQTVSNGKFTYKITTLANGTFGYDIFSGSVKLIHQNTKPGLPGSEGFRRKEDAEKVAKLVIEKLNKNIIPPSVTTREMDSLKIHY